MAPLPAQLSSLQTKSTDKSSSDGSIIAPKKKFAMPISPIFTKTGDHHLDHWLVDGRADFSIFPSGIVADVNVATPIRLSVGHLGFGEVHISHKHKPVLLKHKLSAPEFVYMKLAHSGVVHCCEERDKLKINLTIHPAALIVLTLIEPSGKEPFFSVTTIYQQNRKLDGDKIGRYPGRVAAYRGF